MPSPIYKSLQRGIRFLDKSFLSFGSRPAGNYTKRQMTMAAAYTMLCHAEIESFLEDWSSNFVNLAELSWRQRRATRPLVYICTFHEGRSNLSNVPARDDWNETVGKALAKQRGLIRSNNGIKSTNVLELLSPIGFDTRNIDEILLADLDAFGSIRGDHAHKSHLSLLGTTFDPFDRRAKVQGIELLLLDLDSQLGSYLSTA